MFKCSKCGGEDQNSDGSCARCSSASLREKLKALVEVWRSVADEWRRAADTCGRGSITDALLRNGICVTNDHADQLAALLAESEPEPCAEWRHCEHDGEDGHIACDVLCADCGMHRDAHPDCEAKAKLPLPRR